MSLLDAQFLYLEDSTSPMHIAGLCIFEGPVPNQDDLRWLLTSKLSLIPRYRKHVRFLPFELGRPVWVDDPGFDLGYHLRRTALPAPGDDAALTALMGRLMSHALDRGRPLWELWVVEGLEGGRWAMISKIHHAMVDGIAGVQLNQIVLDTEPSQSLPAPIPWTPERRPSRIALVLDAWRGLAEDAGAVVRGAAHAIRHPADGARALRDRAQGLALFTRKLARLRSGPIQGTIGPHRSYAHAQVTLADVQAIRRTLGGSVNDVVLAAVSGGYRALLAHRGDDPGRARVQSLVPVSVRGPDENGVLHNRVSALLCDLPLQIPDPVERLRAVIEQMSRLKRSHMAEAGAWMVDLGDLAPPMVVGPITRFITRAMHQLPQRILGTVITNVPGPREPLYCLGRRMLEWYPYVPIYQGLRVGTAILSYAGRLSFGITGDYDTARDLDVLARAIEAEMETLRQRAVH